MEWILVATIVVSAVALATIYLKDALPNMGVRSGKVSRKLYRKYLDIA
jgi:hypothetical protein